MFSQQFIGLGTFLTNLGSLINGNDWSTFDLQEKLDVVKSKEYCEAMTNNEKYLQNYFEELGIALGFSKNSSLSLFD